MRCANKTITIFNKLFYENRKILCFINLGVLSSYLNSLFSSSPENVAFRVNSPKSSTEFFVLEYRSRHNTFEWWHNDEGLVISLVNPCARGNARGNNPRPFELFYLRDSENNVMFKNTSLNQLSNPRLALSDGTKAGFSLNNLRIENNQLVFELVFDDEPYINAVEYPELISRSAQTIEWKIETNPSNSTRWEAECNMSWLTLTKDYENGILRLQTTQNSVFRQRNATITLTAPGATSKKTYLVQRGTSTAPVFWMPELDEDFNTVFIPGEENSHNIRLIGDLDGSWWGGDSNITSGRGERQVLHNSINSVYAYRNTTSSNRTATISFRLTDGSQKSFTVTQRPATIPVPTYTSNNGIRPEVNDGNWYFIRTERGGCNLSNFLRPVSSGGSFIIGTGFMAYNDSLLWTIESNGAGNVILRNKALGYIDLNNLSGANVSFSSNKLSNGLILKENVSRGYFYGVAGYAFEGNSSNVKGLHVLTNGIVVNNYYKIDDNCTFFFERPNEHFLKYQGNILLNALKGYESFTDEHEILNLRQRINDISDAQSTAIFNDNATNLVDAFYVVYNTLLRKLSTVPNSQVDNWFVLERFISATWGVTLNEQTKQYLYIPNQFSSLEQEPYVTLDNRFSFKFEQQANAKYHIVNRSLPNLKLSAVGSGVRALNYSPINFELRPIISFRGLKFALINDATKQYLKYNENQRVLTFSNQPDLRSLLNNKSFLFDIQPLSVISSVDFVHDDSFDVKNLQPYVLNGQIISPVFGSKIDVYNLHGIKVKNENLKKGIYVVMVNNKGYKLLVY